MAISNDERREVAARLRNLDEQVLDCREYEHRAICAVVGCWGDGEYSDMELKDRLADLVEPEPDRTCQMELCDTGEWFTPECREEYLFCSNCKFVGYFVQVSEDADYWCAKPNFCPDCGAKVVD